MIVPWDVDSVTWANTDGFKYTISDSTFVTKTKPKGKGFSYYDVTTSVQKMVNGEIDNNGYLIKFAENDCHYELMIHPSNYKVQTYRPKLVIAYDTMAVSNYNTKYSDLKHSMSISNNGVQFNTSPKAGIMTLNSVTGRCIKKINMANDVLFVEFGQTLSAGAYILEINRETVLFSIQK